MDMGDLARARRCEKRNGNEEKRVAGLRDPHVISEIWVVGKGLLLDLDAFFG